MLQLFQRQNVSYIYSKYYLIGIVSVKTLLGRWIRPLTFRYFRVLLIICLVRSNMIKAHKHIWAAYKQNKQSVYSS